MIDCRALAKALKGIGEQENEGGEHSYYLIHPKNQVTIFNKNLLPILIFFNIYIFYQTM